MCIIAVAAGVALAVAVRVQATSLTGGQGIERALVGRTSVEAVARGPVGMPVSVFHAVEKLRSVTAVAPILVQSVAVEGPRGRSVVLLVGGDRRLQQIGSPVGSAVGVPRRARDVGLYLPTDLARTLGVRPGDRMTVVGPSGPRETLLSATLRPEIDEDVGSTPIALAPLGLAQTLTGQHGRLTRLLIVESAQSDRRALRAAVGPTGELRPPDWESGLLAQASELYRRVTDLFALLCIVLGAVVVYAVTLLAAVDRRREIAVLTALGCAPARLIGVIVCEAIIVGGAGGLAGTTAGWALAHALGLLPADHLSFAFTISDELRLGWDTAAAGMLGGIAIAIGATLTASASLIAEPPANALAMRREALRSSRGSHAARAGGATALAGAGVVMVVAPELGVLAICLVLLGATLLVADVLALLVRSIERVRRAPGGAAALGISEIRCSPGRGAATAALVAVVVAGVVTLNSAALNFERSADEVADDTFANADLWATAAGNDAWVTRAISPATADVLRTQPGVADVRPHRTVLMDWHGRRILVYSADTVATQSSLRMDPQGRPVDNEASRSIGDGTAMLISRELAGAHDVKLRDTVTIPTPSGPQSLQIVGYVGNYGWPPGIVGLSSDAIRRWWSEPSLTGLKIDVQTGAQTTVVRQRLTQAAASLGVEIDAPELLRERVRNATNAGLVPLRKTALVLAILGALAATTSLIGVIMQRARRMATLRAIGMENRHVLQSLAAEFATISLAGGLVGLIAGLAAHRMVLQYLVAVHGYPADYGIEPAVLGVTLSVVGAAVLLVPLLSLWWLAKVPIRNTFSDA